MSQSAMDPNEPRKRTKMEESETNECLDLIPYISRQDDVDLQEALVNLKERLQSLVISMSLSEFIGKPNSTLYKLAEETEQVEEFQCAESHVVGFIGDSGVGKSSVINSLLDEKELARSSGDGAACTSVVTEFRSIDSVHPDPYTIEIDFMGSEEIKELLNELLRNFRTFHCPSIFDQLTSDEERDKAKLASVRAMQTLGSLFHDKEELTPGFLGDESEDACEKIAKMLETWASEVLSRRPDHIRDCVVLVTNDSLQSCKDQLDYLMASSHENGDLVLWPFINLIRVYIQSPVLEVGLVVADLPGFRDMNYARVRATERYLLHQCDEVVIVTDISRCVTDQSIVEIRSKCSMKPQQIVCTRSEEICPEEAARGKESHHMQIQLMNEEIDGIKDQIRVTNSKMKQSRSASMRSSFATEQADLMEKLNELKLERTGYLINHRNAHVEKKLKEKHEDTGVFCVSNKLYAENRMEPESPYIGLSGIRELRHHCRRLPAAGHRRLLTAYLNNRIPALLSSIQQWSLAGSDVIANEQAAALQNSLDEVKMAFDEKIRSSDGCVRGTKKTLKKLFKKKVLRLIRISTRSWTRNSAHVSGKWATWHHSTYAAFCRAHGTYIIKCKKEAHCWNTDLIEVPRRKLKPKLEEVTSWLNEEKTILKGKVSKVIDQGCTILRNHEEDAPIAIGNIVPNINSRKETLLRELEVRLTRMVKKTELVSFDMCGGHASSYIATVMLPAYEKCATKAGAGSDKKRKRVMHKHIKSNGIFSKYERHAKNAFEDALNQQFETLEQRVSEQVAGILRDLSTIVVEKGKKSEAEQDTNLTDEIIVKVMEAKRVLEIAQRALGQGTNCE